MAMHDASTSISTRRRSKALQQASSPTFSRPRREAPIRRSAEKRRSGRRAQRDRRGRAARSRRSPFDLEHGDIGFARLSHRRPRLHAGPQWVPPASRRFLEGLEVWVVDALRYTRIPHISVWRRPWRGSRSCVRAAPSSPICTPISTTRRCARACRPEWSPPTTVCASKDFESPCERSALDRRSLRCGVNGRDLRETP